MPSCTRVRAGRRGGSRPRGREGFAGTSRGSSPSRVPWAGSCGPVPSSLCRVEGSGTLHAAAAAGVGGLQRSAVGSGLLELAVPRGWDAGGVPTAAGGPAGVPPQA